ncbi:response regulator transcription factor [uncultured Azonexus sp.]|uniref:response regulator transcription factor n=1 Tax=uncultured Azonexus sp. TaxID=520307 RepID=UPI0026309CE2|nr:response regulator transcription factor [uncultured Azonexus sp.]
MNTVRIVLVDDHLLVRAGIRALLESLPGYQVLAECADGRQAIAEIERSSPDVVLLDIAMPGLSGIEVARLVRRSNPQVRILILSSIDRRDVVDQAFDAGANGYLLKDFILDELQQALLAVMEQRPFLSSKISEQHGTDSASPCDGLTARQTEILRLVANGHTTKEIARDLGISPKTVEFHRARLMQRIGVHDVTGLTRFAVQNGLLN